MQYGATASKRAIKLWALTLGLFGAVLLASPGAKAANSGLSLSNLPLTNATKASIKYTLPASSASSKVYCRRDSFDPVLCPQQFMLGTVIPLTAGIHKVDYYVDSGSGYDVNSPALSYSWTIGAVSSAVGLSSLPAANSTTASIGYSSSASSKVYCRRDSYDPIVCPQQFVLGAVTSLDAGTHKVDYFVDSGSGYDVSKPTLSYSWNIAGNRAPASDTTIPTSNPVPPASTGTTSLKIASPTGWEGDAGNATDVSYSGQTIYSHLGDGLPRIQKMSNYYVHRIVDGDNLVWSGYRSELNYSGIRDLQRGVDYWFAFAWKPVDWDNTGRQIIFQLQMSTSASPCGGPTFEFQASGGNLVFNSNTAAYGCKSLSTISGVSTSLPSIGQWGKYVVHYRLGENSSQNPIIQIWKNGTKILESTDINCSSGSAEYLKTGIYKWDAAHDSNQWGNSRTRVSNMSPIYFGTNSSIGDASAALAGY